MKPIPRCERVALFGNVFTKADFADCLGGVFIDASDGDWHSRADKAGRVIVAHDGDDRNLYVGLGFLSACRPIRPTLVLLSADHTGDGAIAILSHIRHATVCVEPERRARIRRVLSWLPKPYLSYDEYLGSIEWAEKRERQLALANRLCQRCTSAEDLQVHHLTYDRIGREADGDLVVLCRKCHAKEHSVAADPASDVRP